MELQVSEYRLFIDSLARYRGALLVDYDLSGRCYLEGLIKQVDGGLLLAERLSDIISKKEEDEQRAVLGFESAPSLRPYLTILCKAVDLTGTMPTCREELRRRYAIMGSAWEMIRLRSPSHPLLCDYTPAIFNETLLGFLFGDKLFKDAGILGVSSTASSTWPFIVHLEYTLREKVFKNIREYHLSLAQLISATITDQVFTSQISTLFVLMAQAARKDDKGGARGVQHQEGSSANGFNAGECQKGVPFFKILRSSRLRKRLVLSGPDGKVCFRHQKVCCDKEGCAFAHNCAGCGAKGIGLDWCTFPGHQR